MHRVRRRRRRRHSWRDLSDCGITLWSTAISTRWQMICSILRAAFRIRLSCSGDWQAGLLLRPFGCGQEDAAWLDLDGGLVVGLQLVRLAVEPDMAGGCSRSGAVPEHLLQGGFIMLQPAAQLGQA